MSLSITCCALLPLQLALSPPLLTLLMIQRRKLKDNRKHWDFAELIAFLISSGCKCVHSEFFAFILINFLKINCGSGFIIQERDEMNKYTYFEVLFLGREGDSFIHEQRLRLLYRLASYALQFPVLQLYAQISLWLSKVGKVMLSVIFVYRLAEITGLSIQSIAAAFDGSTLQP